MRLFLAALSLGLALGLAANGALADSHHDNPGGGDPPPSSEPPSSGDGDGGESPKGESPEDKGFVRSAYPDDDKDDDGDYPTYAGDYPLPLSCYRFYPPPSVRRDPYDAPKEADTPAPPPTTPPTTPPPTLPPSGSTTPAATPGIPVPPGPTTPDPDGPKTRRGKTATEHTAWQTWWKLNRLAYLPGREEIARRRATLITNGDPAATEGAKRALAAERLVIPHLLAQLSPYRDVEYDVRAAALLGLTRLTNEPAVLDLVDWYARNLHVHPAVRDAAALAAGLARRSAADLQAPARYLDRARGRLLSLFDSPKAHWRTRAYAAFSLGLLGDQPFGDGVNRDGLLVSRGLWLRLKAETANKEMSVALLTALGMQPSAGVPHTVKEDLERIVMGRRVQGRKWSDVERAHALATAVRLNAPGWTTWLPRVMTSPRTSQVVLQAAWVVLGANADKLTPDEHEGIVQSWGRFERNARQPLTGGLMRIAHGRLLATAFAAKNVDVLTDTSFAQHLLHQTAHDPANLRGYSSLALALAAQEAAGHEKLEAFGDKARALLTKRFVKADGAAMERAADAAALGLMGPDKTGRTALCDCLKDSNEPAQLRAACAVALGQCGAIEPQVRLAMIGALWDRRDPSLRPEAALALSFLPRESSTLVRELGKAERTQWGRRHVAAALGRMADMKVVADVLAMANEPAANRLTRAAAIAAMAAITDPEPRPSLLRLALDANYPASTQALRNALAHL